MNALLTARIIDSLFTREYNDNIINNNNIHRLKRVSKAARKTPVAFAVNAEQVRGFLFYNYYNSSLFFASGDENGGKKERIFRRICGLNTDFIHIIIYIYYPKQTNKQTESGRRSHRYGWRRGHVNFDAR